MNGLQLPQQVAATLDRWHSMIGDAASRENSSPILDGLEGIVREDAVFRSPVAHVPYPGREAVCLVLRTAAGVFTDFVYQRQFASPDGFSVVLEFTARIGNRELTGIDMIRFDEAGMIGEFMVMIRPATGLMALGEAMGKALADRETLLKGN